MMKPRPFFSATVFALCVVVASVAARPAQAQKFEVLYSFAGPPDGAVPYAGVIRDSRGNLYGTTFEGGIHDKGTVFMLDTTGKETVLHNFTGQADGELPYAGLVRDSAGNLYGTASNGGRGYGVVFKVDTAGKETVLFNFTGPKGASPRGTLLRDSSGSLYGTTLFGGADGGGTVFKVSEDGKEKVLHSFGGGSDGSNPYFVKLVRDRIGNFYGTTAAGGQGNTGSVFKMNKRGAETVLSSFDYGIQPDAGLVMDADGNLYGTTPYGGLGQYDGIIFKVDVTGNQTVLYSFCPGGYPCIDGSSPYAGLVQDAAGNLYGTTFYGGLPICNCGTVFKLDTAGTETVLYSFNGGADGYEPYAGLVMDAAGNLYGTAGGGVYGYGVVFKITP